jgi:hypothetical protein
MDNKTLTCTYCAAINPAGTDRCISCGAPIDIPVSPPMRVTVVDTPVVNPMLEPQPPTAPVSESIKEGLAAVGAGIGTLGIFGVIARTGAEALAIAGAALVIGYTSAQARELMIAILGGIAVGLAVGFVTKRAFFTLISAPAGALLGVVIATFSGLNQPRTLWMPLFAAVGAVVLAVLGGRRRSGVWQKIRPYLGLIGGVLFALLGYAIGYRIY